jgi:lipoate-protein ligase A
VRPAESYRLIHLALFEVLAGGECHYELAAQDCPKRSSACFDNPVRSDLLRNGKKIAGAGQRRSRAGLLHQGSVQIPESEHPSGETLAKKMAGVVEAFSLTPDILQASEALAANKYASPDWNTARLERESHPPAESLIWRDQFGKS